MIRNDHRDVYIFFEIFRQQTDGKWINTGPRSPGVNDSTICLHQTTDQPTPHGNLNTEEKKRMMNDDG